jgi:hypothetical protein
MLPGYSIINYFLKIKEAILEFDLVAQYQVLRLSRAKLLDYLFTPAQDGGHPFSLCEALSAATNEYPLSHTNSFNVMSRQSNV